MIGASFQKRRITIVIWEQKGESFMGRFIKDVLGRMNALEPLA